MLTRGREAQAHASPDTVLFPLPHCFVRALLLLLPVDTRLRCSEVSRAWRALLADTTFWGRIDLGASSGVERFSWPLLRAAVAKAGGQLRVLDISGQGSSDHSHLLLEVVTASAATLTELRMDTIFYRVTEGVRPLLEAGPALQLLEASMLIRDLQVARAVLRNEPPFQALRLWRMWLYGLDATLDVVTFGSDLRCHSSLEALYLQFVALDTAAALGAVVDACIALRPRLCKLQLGTCRVVPASIPQLTRLNAAGTLRELKVHNGGVEMFDKAHESTRLFVAAARASALTKLDLNGLGDVPENVAEAAAFINARQL